MAMDFYVNMCPEVACNNPMHADMCDMEKHHHSRKWIKLCTIL